MKTTIKEYTEDDKESCLIAFKSNVPKYFTVGETELFEKFLDKLAVQNINDKSQNIAYYYVIESGNKVLGCGGFGDKENNNIVSLAWGLVHNDFHKKGFGEKLLVHRLKLIKELYPTAQVVVDTTQYSYPFFEKFGFVTTKITLNSYAEGMHRYDMVLGGE